MKDYVNETIIKAKQLASLLDDVKGRIEVLERSYNVVFQTRLKLAFPRCTFDTYMSTSGYMYNDWSPSLHIRYVNQLRYTDKNYWINHNNAKTDDPLNANTLLNLLDDLSKEFGMKCDLLVEHIKTKEDVDRLKCIEDILLVYENIEILCAGDIQYKGWDIPDSFYICIYENEYILFLSTNGHGFGVDHIITKKDGVKQLNFFFDKIKEDEEAYSLAKPYYSQILKSFLN